MGAVCYNSFVMRQTIPHRLTTIERRENIRVLFACESGSRAWGFASPDSDYDVRFIYVRPMWDYLRVDPPRDVIEQPLSDDLDINGWDLFKAMGLLRKSNPPLLEWLGSPIIYTQRGDFADRVRTLADQYFSLRRCCEHYRSMAKNNWQSYIEARDVVHLKKYLYALRPMMCAQWVMRHATFPPTAFRDVCDGLDLAPDLRTAIAQFIQRKEQISEQGDGPRDALFDAYLTDILARLDERLPTIEHRDFPAAPVNALIESILRNP